MSDDFESKLHAAATAGWWTLLIGVSIFLIQWVAYLIVVPSHPHWVLALWGPGTDWQQMAVIWFWFLAGFKVCLLAVAFVLVWLTLWARQMRKARRIS
jgi:hypothetical protein